MDWLKHDSNAKEDPLISDLITEFGHSGYFFWFGILEEITDEMSPGSDRCYVSFRLSDWCRKLRTKWKKLIPFLLRINLEPSCNLVLTDLETGSILDQTDFDLSSISVPSQIMVYIENSKALKLLDTRNGARAKRGRREEEDKEKEKEVDKKAPAPPASPKKGSAKKEPARKKPYVECPQELIDCMETQTIPDKYLAWSRKKEVKDYTAKKEFSKFVRHWLADGKKWADWYRAWQKWLDNHIEWNKPVFQDTNPHEKSTYDPQMYETVKDLRMSGLTDDQIRDKGFQI